MAKSTHYDQVKKWSAKLPSQFAENKVLGDAQRKQLTEWSAGLARAVEEIEQVTDPTSPPAPGTVHDMLIRYGRARLQLGAVLAGEVEEAKAPASAPEAPAAEVKAPEPAPAGAGLLG